MTEVTVDDSVHTGYEDVRNDSTESTWAIFGYADDINGGDVNTITFSESGSGPYSELVAKLIADYDGKRAYAFLRYTSGDELSARAKFVFISYVPDNTPIRKRASVSTHKGLVKQVVKDFAIELHATDEDDLSEEDVVKALKKAGGADYGTSSS